MIYFAAIGWTLALLGWWFAWNLFRNLRIFIQVAAQRERTLIQERINLIDNLQAAFDAAEVACKQEQKVPNARGSGTTLN